MKLGVGKNMVDSIRYWCLSTGVIEEVPGTVESRIKALQVSDFGRRLLLDDGWDAYLEDDASLWLLHYRLVTNPVRATTWYFTFNLYGGAEFTKEGLRDALKRYADTQTGGGINIVHNKDAYSITLYSKADGGRINVYKLSESEPVVSLP